MKARLMVRLLMIGLFFSSSVKAGFGGDGVTSFHCYSLPDCITFVMFYYGHSRVEAYQACLAVMYPGSGERTENWCFALEEEPPTPYWIVGEKSTFEVPRQTK